MVPVCCHLIVSVSAFYRYFVFSLLSAVTLYTCQCDCHTPVVRAQELALKKLEAATPLFLSYQISLEV